MRLIRSNFVTVLVAVGSLLGCTAQGPSNSNTRPTTQAPVQSEDDHAAQATVPRINIKEAQAAVEKGEAIFLDVRQAEAYRVGHIKGAISLPEADIPLRASMLPRDKKIIAYCA